MPLIRHLREHTVTTAMERGWDRLRNGDLLLTTDNCIAYQQNLKSRRIAIVVLSRNRWRSVQRMLPRIAATVNAATPGSYVQIDIPVR